MRHEIEYKLGERVFVLDQEKARVAQNEKRVINGRQSLCFNLLPLKYHWAYDLYKKMEASSWTTEDIQMGADIELWRSNTLSDSDRWVVMMALGYFSAAEGIVGDNVATVARQLVTAPELKLVLGRHAWEEHVHADSLLYAISSLGINPHTVEAMFEQIPSIIAKNEFVARHSTPLRVDADMTLLHNKKLFAKNLFVFGQCMEGTQFYGLFGMVLNLYRRGILKGFGQMIRYTLADESNHIEVFRQLLMDLIIENPDIWEKDFKEDLRKIMREAISLEHMFIDDCLPLAVPGLNAEEFKEYISFIGNRRLVDCGLSPLDDATNTLPWLAELMDLKKEQNFFEGIITEYSKSSTLVFNDDEL